MSFRIMPKKIRELKQMLLKSGFIERPGKGSHTNWTHPDYAGRVTIAGKDSADAKRYLEKEVEKAIEQVKRKEQDG
jgi:predicted RNA binding protein YcfA (HicA-like mRNA interferase family)